MGGMKCLHNVLCERPIHILYPRWQRVLGCNQRVPFLTFLLPVRKQYSAWFLICLSFHEGKPMPIKGAVGLGTEFSLLKVQNR